MIRVREIKYSIVAVMMLVLVLAGGAGAATIYVPDSYAKIQWTVDNASAGDTIIVKDDKRLTIKSESVGEAMVVQGASSGDSIFI